MVGDHVALVKQANNGFDRAHLFVGLSIVCALLTEWKKMIKH